MMKTSALLPCWKLIASLLLALPSLPAWAAAPVITSITLPSYTAPGYVIDADSVDGVLGTNRHRIATEAVIDFGAPPSANSYAVVWALLDASGAEVGSGGTVMGINISGVRTVSGHVTPSTRLLPGALYRVKATVQENSVAVTDSTEAPGHTFIHLTGTEEDTTALNAVAAINSVSIGRTWLLDTAGTLFHTIPVSVNFSMYRYDHWSLSAPATGSVVPVTFTAVLKRASDGAVMASTTSDATTSVGLDEFVAGSPNTPDAETPAAHTLRIDPVGVLPPDNYLVEVTVSHTDTPPSTTITGNTAATASTGLLHYSGVVDFGPEPVHTTVTSFSVAPATYFGAPGDVPGVSAHRTISIGAGSIDGSGGSWTFTGAFQAQLTASGTAIVVNGSTTVTGGVGADHLNGVDYSRGSITLDATGAHASVKASLPVGVGWAATRDEGLLEPAVDFGTQDLDQDGHPTAALVTKSFSPGSFYLCEETKPVYVEATAFQWDTASGNFSVPGVMAAHSIVKPLLNALASYTYADPALGIKRSNHFLYNSVSQAQNTSFKKGVSGGGEMTTQFTLGAGDMRTHFPYDAQVKWNGVTSQLTVAADLLEPTASVLNQTTFPLNVAVGYYQHCQEVIEGTCGGSEQTGTVSLAATSGFSLTADGGVFLPGAVSSGGLLAWGYSDVTSTYAHRQLTGFTAGNFLMAGTFLRGDQNALADEEGLGVLLLSGFNPANLSAAERPSTVAYLSGLGDYAGVNFRCSSGGPYTAESRVSGTLVPSYSLTSRSKYYARLSGVTGIHEAPTGPGGVAISGYQFTFDTWGFSFLSNEMEDSRTSGDLDLPQPTDFTLAFDEIQISCLGVLEELILSSATTAENGKIFSAWASYFTAHSASFVPENPCDPSSPIYLELGFGGHASHFDLGAFTGSLGILSTGHFARPSDAVPVPSRLTLPGSLTMTSSTGEAYQFMPNQGAYLNDDPSAAGEGFWSLFGTLDVPFFEDMQVQLHTRCGYDYSTSPADDLEITTNLYVMGGWPSFGWTESTLNPFQAAVFDQINTGYPTTTLASYRDSGSMVEQYKPRAQKLWLGVVNFDYPLVWSTTTSKFTGLAPVENDLLVLSTEHQLQYLDSDNTEITFGVQYDGLPQINTANILFDSLETTGVNTAIKNAVGDVVFDSLENSINDFNAMLSDEMEDMLSTALSELITDGTQPFFNALSSQTDAAALRANLNTLLNTHFRGTSNTLVTELNKLSNSLTTTTSVIRQIDDRLARIQVGIQGVIDTVSVDPNNPIVNITPVNGLLKDIDIGGGELEKQIFKGVAEQLINLLQAAVNSSDVQAQLSEVLADLDPTLDAVKSALTQVNTLIADIRLQLRDGINFADELESIVTSAATQLQAASDAAADRMEELIANMTDEDFEQIDALIQEWSDALAQEITDALMGSQLMADLQEAVKHRLYDLQSAFNSAVDTAFAALNDMIRDALSPVLAELDNTINRALGEVAGSIGAGSLTGYAHINGDSLDEARIDGSFELSVPDELTLAAYLQIRELDSDGPAGCTSPTGGNITEVSIGALDIPLAWLGVSGSDLRADLGVKFALDSTTGEPTGLGGSFELTSGEISFETMKITDLGAAAMFGLTENYFAANIGMEFGEYAMSGGVFFGRACTIDPLEMIDPLVASVLTMPSFTGVYCYGEATFPIYGTGTCFFSISGKAGAGVFYFEEGPTYGGRLTLGVYGEALCAVEVGGEVSLVGAKSGSTYSFAGTGRVYGRAGPCPVCVEAEFNASFNYTDAGGWKVNF